MDELDWWTSPIDHHGHPDGPRPDECAVCALQVDRDRLRVEGDALREWGHHLEAGTKILAAELARLRDDVTGLRMLLTETTAERDQLRAGVERAEREWSGMRDARDEAAAERDRLRAIVDLVREHRKLVAQFVDFYDEAPVEAIEAEGRAWQAICAALDALDISADIGGEP